MKDLPISKYVKEYYKKHGIMLSDFEKATIYFNDEWRVIHDFNKTLQELAESTEDMALKAQLEERIRYENKHYEKFFDNRSGEYIYKIPEFGKGSDEFFFTSAEKAIEFGMKYFPDDYIFMAKKSIDPDNFDKCKHYVGRCKFDKKGNVIFVESSEEVDMEYPTDTHGKFQRFEYAFHPFEFPFERGDIITTQDEHILGVVDTSRKEWEDFCKYSVGRKNVTYIQFDSFVHIYRILAGTHISSEYCNMFELDKITDPEPEEPAEWNMINGLSRLLCGKGDFLEFAGYFNIYQDECEMRKMELTD